MDTRVPHIHICKYMHISMYVLIIFKRVFKIIKKIYCKIRNIDNVLKGVNNDFGHPFWDGVSTI